MTLECWLCEPWNNLATLIIGGPRSGIQTTCLNYMGECPTLVYGRRGRAFSLMHFLGGIALEFLSCVGHSGINQLVATMSTSLSSVACH
jgi:hypothetical protein